MNYALEIGSELAEFEPIRLAEAINKFKETPYLG